LSTDFDNHHSGDRNGTPVPPPRTSDPSRTDSGSNYDAAADGSTTKPQDGGKGKGDDAGGSPSLRKSLQGCGVPEVVTLQPWSAG
jgi:hypothetical protein